LCKLEQHNPGGSLKDRIALHMIEKAEREGRLKPGDVIVDISSGNTGIGEAMVAAAKGYKCIIAMPEAPVMYERYLTCRMLGAEVHLLNRVYSNEAMLKYVEELGQQEGFCYINQFYSDYNPEAHIVRLGPEIWSQTHGQIDYFVHGIGTGGCVQGVGTFLKAKKPAAKIIAVEPSESRIHIGEPKGKHAILGIGAGLRSAFLGEPDGAFDEAPRGVVDEWAHVDTPSAMQTVHRMCQLEGMMIGPSAGASLKVAFDIAARPEAAGKTIVVVIPSHALRYTKTPLWDELMAECARALPAIPVSAEEKPLLLWNSSDELVAAQ